MPPLVSVSRSCSNLTSRVPRVCGHQVAAWAVTATLVLLFLCLTFAKVLSGAMSLWLSVVVKAAPVAAASARNHVQNWPTNEETARV